MIYVIFNLEKSATLEWAISQSNQNNDNEKLHCKIVENTVGSISITWNQILCCIHEIRYAHSNSIFAYDSWKLITVAKMFYYVE